MHKHKLMSILAVVIGLAVIPGPGRAVELGLTPSHVFSTWTNINAALVAMGSVLTEDDVSRGIAQMAPTAFTGKKPGDVLKQVEVFRDKLDRLKAKSGLKATPVYRDPLGGTVTPSVVFLNSGNVLDSLMLLLIRTDGERLIGGFYSRHDITGKSPSNVFSMVDLANRRMATLMQKTAN